MTPRTTTIVFTHGGGRLANQLFLHANLLAFCLEHSPRFSLCNAAILPYKSLLPRSAHLYGSPATVISRASEIVFSPNPLIPKRFKTERRRLTAMCRLFPKVPRVSNLAELQNASQTNSTVMLSGWDFNSDDLLARHKKEVLRRLKLSFNKTRVDSIMQSARSGADNIIGVHIRHGDYASYNNGIYMYSTQEYATAMKSMAASLSPRKVKFVVCSDTQQQAEHFQNLDVIFSENTSPSDDITILSRCDYILGTHSTFNRWAAFIGDRPVFCLDRTCPDLVAV